MRKQTGFTLIELIVVMIILGVLATTALPKFMDVTSQSHEAAVAGTGGAFGSAVSLAHAQWIANGHVTSIDDLAGFGDGTIDTSTSGWPTDTAGNNDLSTATHCINIWNGLMLNPPTAVTGSSTKASYIATVNASANTCTYTYNKATNMSITYDADTGNVSVDSDSTS